MSTLRIKMRCAQCQNDLNVPEGFTGQNIYCSRCGTPNPIRSASDPHDAPPSCVAAGQNKACPSCEKFVPDDTVVCLKCGYDWRTGRRLQSVRSPRISWQWIVAAIVILSVIGAAGYWGILHNKVRNEQQIIAADTAGVSSAIASATNAMTANIETSISMLRAAMPKYPKARNKAQAEALLEVLQAKHVEQARLVEAEQARLVENKDMERQKDTLCKAMDSAKLESLPATAIAMLRDAIDKCPKAPNRPEAENLIQQFVALEAEGSNAWFDGNLYDYLVVASAQRPIPLAIDPEIVGDLARIQICLPSEILCTNIAALRNFLKPYGFDAQSVKLAPQLTVIFITTPALWTYGTAMWQIKNGNMESAKKILNEYEKTSDTTYYALQCRELMTIVNKIGELDREFTKIEKDIDEHLNASISSAKRVKMQELAMANAIGRNETAGIGANTAYQKAADEANQCLRSMLTFLQVFIQGNRDVAARLYDDINDLSLHSEAVYLLNYLSSNYSRLKNIADNIQNNYIPALRSYGLNTRAADFFREISDQNSAVMINFQADLGVMPPELKEFIENHRKIQIFADKNVEEGREAVVANPSHAIGCFTTAYGLDDGLIMARIGCGYIQVKNAVDALSSLSRPTPVLQQPALLAKLEREFRGMNKSLRLNTVQRLNSGNIDVPKEPLGSLIGKVNGLAVKGVSKEGSLSPMFIQLAKEPPQIRRNPVRKDIGYWESVWVKEHQMDWISESRIYYGDYGTKDLLMEVASVQVTKWLQSIDTNKTPVSQWFRVDFHDLFANKGGDSAGATLALAAFSAWRRIPIRQDVAMTGSLRVDGSVKAVGGIPQKVAGTLAPNMGIEIVIVPLENRADLVAVPFDQLCKLTIILADNMKTYMRYALDESATGSSTNQTHMVTVLEDVPSKDSTKPGLIKQIVVKEVPNPDSSLVFKNTERDLREAQVLLLMGEVDRAASILRFVAAANPEIYNAKRLLELISIHKSAAKKS